MGFLAIASLPQMDDKREKMTTWQSECSHPFSRDKSTPLPPPTPFKTKSEKHLYDP